MLRFGSVCSGIEAASVAWEPLGWKAAWFSEIEKFPSAVLQHHYPSVPNYGDMLLLADRILKQEIEAPDVLCGGTPCQAFSLAGSRGSLDDDRGNLSLTFCEVADAIDSIRERNGQQPTIIFWENVPGVLSTKDNAFGHFLAGLAGEDVPIVPAGKKWTNAGVVLGPKRAVAWRVLDAQHFGVPQQRSRVFVVASAGRSFDAIAALFEREINSRDSSQIGQQGVTRKECSNGSEKETTGSDAIKKGTRGIWWNAKDVSQTLDAVLYKKQALPEKTRFPAVLVPIWQQCDDCEDFICNLHDDTHAYDCDCPGIDAFSNLGISPYAPIIPRFISPEEAEALQGFPKGYTAIPWRNKPADECPDGPRYKAIGNSWAVPVVRWIGARIDAEMKWKKYD